MMTMAVCRGGGHMADNSNRISMRLSALYARRLFIVWACSRNHSWLRQRQSAKIRAKHEFKFVLRGNGNIYSAAVCWIRIFMRMTQNPIICIRRHAKNERKWNCAFDCLRVHLTSSGTTRIIQSVWRLRECHKLINVLCLSSPRRNNFERLEEGSI